MAQKESRTDTAVFIAGILGAGYITYTIAKKPDAPLGETLYLAAKAIEQWLIGAGKAPGDKDKDKPANRCSIPATGNLSRMQDENRNIVQQIKEWQAARKAAGQNQYDWQAFRVHLGALGDPAPDPGPNPPSIFCQ